MEMIEWMQANSALCNAQMTKMQRLDPKYARMFRINGQDEVAMLKLGPKGQLQGIDQPRALACCTLAQRWVAVRVVVALPL